MVEEEDVVVVVEEAEEVGADEVHDNKITGGKRVRAVVDNRCHRKRGDGIQGMVFGWILYVVERVHSLTNPWFFGD